MYRLVSNTKIEMLLHKTFQPIVEYQVRNKKKILIVIFFGRDAWFTLGLLYASASPTFFIAPLGRCFAQLASSDEMKSDTKIKQNSFFWGARNYKLEDCYWDVAGWKLPTTRPGFGVQKISWKFMFLPKK